jgi:hypothetical protein
VIVAAALTGVVLFVAAGMIWTARLIHVGNLDMHALAEKVATLLVALDGGDHRSLPLLSQWCERQASIAPVRRQGAELELRRRQSLERVHAVMVAEDCSGASG